MTLLTEDNREIREYLLGLLPEEEQQRVEQRLLADADFFEELLLNEEELIDLYLSGALSARERDRFESHFLSTPERQRKLRFAGTFAGYVRRRGAAQPAPPPAERREAARTAPWHALWPGRSWAVPAAALALVLVAVIAGALWLSRERQPRTYAPLALSITTGATRGESPQAARVRLPLGADALRVSLSLPERADARAVHRAELMDGTGATESLAAEASDARTVSVQIPAARLRRGQYSLKLFETRAGGTEERIEGSYIFIVE